MKIIPYIPSAGEIAFAASQARRMREFEAWLQTACQIPASVLYGSATMPDAANPANGDAFGGHDATTDTTKRASVRPVAKDAGSSRPVSLEAAQPSDVNLEKT